MWFRTRTYLVLEAVVISVKSDAVISVVGLGSGRPAAAVSPAFTSVVCFEAHCYVISCLVDIYAYVNICLYTHVYTC
jgi:hypothetical protein